MRSFTVTALAATGLLGIGAPAQAGTGPAAHDTPVVHGTPAPAHPAFARPQARPAAQPQAEPRRRVEPGAEPRRHPQPEPGRGEPARTERVEPPRAAYALNMTGQAEHWEVTPDEVEVVRWTLTNAGQRRLEHVQLLASVPQNWKVRDGEGCTRRGAYLACDLGTMEPGRSAAVVVPMVAERPFGAVRLTAWSRASAGRLTIPGPTTSFRVFVVRHH